MASLTIPNSVTSIGDAAFIGCSGLKKITLNSDAIVSKSYYYSDKGLRDMFGDQVSEYVLGDAITKIGECAFENCDSLTSVTISNSMSHPKKSRHI